MLAGGGHLYPTPEFGSLPLPRTNSTLLPPPSSRSTIFDIDSHTLLAADIANDVILSYKSREMERRPRPDYLEYLRKDHITPKIRALCVDWIVMGAESLCLAPPTLHLAVVCLDRYLSGNEVVPKWLPCVGLTCLMTASKYEEMGQPAINFDVYGILTKGKYSKQDFIEMEERILRYLDYDLGTPTVWSFLERFVCAAQGGLMGSGESLNYMAAFLADVSLASYSMLHFRPSEIAASCVFLARYVVYPWRTPWDATLQHYTQYKACDLDNCVTMLHSFCNLGFLEDTPILVNKYSQWNQQGVALKPFPRYVPHEYFEF